MTKTGELIKKLRKARKISQFDLELAIEAGFGSLSKIERGQVQASKQTLARITRALKLPPHEVIALYGIDLSCYRDVISSINKIYAQTNLQDCLQTIVNEINNNLNLVGTAIFLIESDMVRFKTTSQGWYTEKLLGILGKKIESISFNLSSQTPSPQVQAALSKQLVLTQSLYEAVAPNIDKTLADIISALVGIEVIGFLPIIPGDSVNQEPLGVIGFAVNKSHIVDEILPLLYGYLDSAALAISRFQHNN